MDEPYQHIIDKEFSWSAWVAPKDANGNPGHNNAFTGDCFCLRYVQKNGLCTYRRALYTSGRQAKNYL